LLDNISFDSPFEPPFDSSFTSSGTECISFNSRRLVFSSCDFSWQHYSQNSYKYYGVKQPCELANATAKRHSEFIAGRYCAIQAIKRLCYKPISVGQSQVTMQPDRSPLWPEGIIGSISHSSERAIAVVGSARDYVGLGIDCENLPTDTASPDITDLVLKPREQALLLARDQDYPFLLTLAFSAKESLFKALFPSVSALTNLHDFSICSISAKKLALSPSTTISDHWPSKTEFTIDYTEQSGHILTMATVTSDQA
jgi:enterobactin synthetase component D